MPGKDFLSDLLELGRKNDYINASTTPTIPELEEHIETTCQYVLSELTDYYEYESSSMFVSTALAWCAYAGMGATYLWKEDWEGLEETGVYNALTEERGIEEMDEFVLDTIGIPFGSDEAQRLTDFLQILSLKGIAAIHDSSNVYPTFVECAKAMFCFGCAVAKSRMGLS